MSTQRIFDNIVNQFNSDEEEENEENESLNHSEEKRKHTKSSSINESANNQIKEKLSNLDEEKTEEKENKQTEGDELGDLNNDNENNYDNEINDDNENKEKSESNEYKEEEKKEDDEVENLSNKSEKENKEEENDGNTDDNNNNYENNNDNNEEIEEGENEQTNENDNINNEELTEIEERKVEEQNEEKEEEQKEENEIIDELYNKTKTEIEQSEGELFRMGSFRPNPIPGSPKFSKRISKNEESKISNQTTNKENNLTNFTETIETKIEEDKNNFQNNEVNNYNPSYTHENNIVSLGKMPSFKINNNNENFNKIIDTNKKVIEVHQDKSNEEEEEKAEEDFLKKEELKRIKTKEMYEIIMKQKEQLKIQNEINENNKKSNQKDEEEGKENVTEDEEDKKNNNNNIKYKNKNESGQIETKADSKEIINEINSSKNSINNENNIKKNGNKNYMDEIKVKDMSIKLLGQYQNAANSLGNSSQHSIKNSGIKNNDINNINNNNNKNERIKRNIYSKKIAPNVNNNKKYENVNNKMHMSKRGIYDSPSDNYSGKKNANYSTDQNNTISTYKNISSFKYDNSNKFAKKINTQKRRDNRQKNGDNKSGSQIKNKKNEEEKYTFKPKINENSRKIYEQQLIEINNNINPKGQKQTTPLGLLMLYEDANITREKINQEYIKQNNNIISNANKKKINNNSYNMVNDRLNKKIDNAINKFQKNYQLNIIGMTQCLYELNIIHELIKPKDNMNDRYINNQLDLSELQAMVESINKKDIKKTEEVELIEQLWYLLNPKLEQSFNCEILSIFLKLFFCGNYTKKELEECIISLLDNYKINNIEKNEEYNSPLRVKKYNKNEIWPLSTFISVFLDLKKNLIAYRENDYTKGDVYNNIIKEKEKNLTFEPNFISNKYFYKYSNFQYNKDNSIIGLINKFNNKNPKQKHDFNRVYERFKAERELHEKTLQKMRQIQEEKELKMCTNVPKINEYKSPFRSPTKSKSKDKNKNKKILNTEENNLQISKSFIKQPRYKILYDLRKKYSKKEKEERIDKDDIVDENCTFKPKISSREMMEKSFSTSKNKKPRGFNDYVNKKRALIEEKKSLKKIEEDKRYGRNYDKIKKMKIQPLNISFSNRSPSKPKRNISYINTEIKPKKVYNLENEINENIINDIYISLDIKVKDDIIKQLKIYNKPDKDTIEDISNFCKIYSINEKIKKDLIKMGLKYKFNFFGKNIDNTRGGSIPTVDIDTIEKI